MGGVDRGWVGGRRDGLGGPNKHDPSVATLTWLRKKWGILSRRGSPTNQKSSVCFVDIGISRSDSDAN